jgi:uncharacterized DUF497 family protein
LRDEPHVFAWDETNSAHVRRHRVWDWEVDQILGNDHVVVPNRNRRRRRLFVIGTTDGGRVVTVAIERTRVRGTYRPITAWPSTGPERAKLEKRR